jgi:hypothetical protein
MCDPAAAAGDGDGDAAGGKNGDQDIRVCSPAGDSFESLFSQIDLLLLLFSSFSPASSFLSHGSPFAARAQIDRIDAPMNRAIHRSGVLQPFTLSPHILRSDSTDRMSHRPTIMLSLGPISLSLSLSLSLLPPLLRLLLQK